MEIKGFSRYELDEQGRLWSTARGKRKEIGGGIRDNVIFLRADDGRAVQMRRVKVQWCVAHGISPLDFPEGDFIVSKRYGIVSKSELMARKNAEHYRAWTIKEAREELERSRYDIEVQLEYLETGDMGRLLLRFEEYREDATTDLVRKYGVNPDTARLIMESVYDAFIANVQAHFPIHNVHAYVIGASKRHLRAYRKERRNLKLFNNNFYGEEKD